MCLQFQSQAKVEPCIRSCVVQTALNSSPHFIYSDIISRGDRVQAICGTTLHALNLAQARLMAVRGECVWAAWMHGGYI